MRFLGPALSSARRAPALAIAIASLATAGAAHAAGACSARSGPATTPLVELYTSEGCSSCPPADRWLSALKADPAVVALAFHVDYWDRLGWKDRFASAAFTARQAQQQASNGARFSYTPQVVVDGRDRTDWPRIAAPIGARQPAPVAIELAREGGRVTATVAASARAPQRLAAYWALTEHGHVSAVKSGENQGATLQHDFVVRDFRQEPAWAASPGATRTLAYEAPVGAGAAHPRQVNLVVIDAANGRPVQALKLAC